ncbi:MAG TPA: hypothetical protein DD666_08325 [Advenella kashmirensis]|uniref:Uncharacterized protein n=1 Tax=Advenella kashmirensis TaxID=310575 RepID=A0A356LEI2_9BURK|nr:hypothetical protein [Advenella kashmirensis]
MIAQKANDDLDIAAQQDNHSCYIDSPGSKCRSADTVPSGDIWNRLTLNCKLAHIAGCENVENESKPLSF